MDHAISQQVREGLHAALDKVLDMPQTQGVIFLAAAVCDGNALIMASLHGTLKPADVIRVCGEGGSRLMEKMVHRDAPPAGEKWQ